jgi:hypothetical protein
MSVEKQVSASLREMLAKMRLCGRKYFGRAAFSVWGISSGSGRASEELAQTLLQKCFLESTYHSTSLYRTGLGLPAPSTTNTQRVNANEGILLLSMRLYHLVAQQSSPIWPCSRST